MFLIRIKIKQIVFLLLSSLLLSACVSDDGGEDELKAGTEISDTDALKKLIVTVDDLSISDKGDYFLGEYLRDSEAIDLTLTLRNPSSKRFTNLVMEFDDFLVKSFKFKPNDEGEEIFPGKGGTCKSVLASGASCKISVIFSHNKSEVSKQKINIRYKNLIGDRKMSFSLSYLSGTAAKLIFDGEEGTQFPIGDLVGAAEKPVIERTLETSYEKTLRVKNTGELSARSLVFSEIETCKSTLTNVCPTGYGEVYEYQHNCPSVLKSGESCRLSVTLTPKNQDPVLGPTPDEIREILYSDIITTDYNKDPLGGTGSLSSYFSSYSTQIQAHLDVTIDTLDFSTTLTVGNREKEAFRLINSGYRSGKLKSLNILDSSDNLIGKCIKPLASSDLINCYEATLTTPLTLEELSFFFTDTSNCLAPVGSPDKEIEVDGVCLFNLVFQPSVEYLTDKTFDIKIQAEYDNQWQNQLNIVTNNLFSSHAESFSAAQMTFKNLSFDGNYVTDLTINNGVKEYDLGRLALISPNYPYFRSLVFTFSNGGTTDAFDTRVVDGSGTIIPFSDDNPSGVSLGLHEPKFFQSTFANGSQCKIINGDCSLISSFAPFGLSTSSENEQNMFDYIGSPSNQKIFILEYDDGSVYSDSNRDTTIRDIPKRQVEVHLTATLIMKGFLQNLTQANNSSSFSPGNPIQGEFTDITYILRNIGTGPIDYIGFTTSLDNTSTLIPTSNLASYGAAHDCLDLVDFNFSGSDNYSDLMSRSTNWTSLGVEEVCALTYRMELKNIHRVQTSEAFPTLSGDFLEFARSFNKVDQMGGPDSLWELPYDIMGRARMRFIWFDGDESDPSVTGLPNTNPEKYFGQSYDSGHFSKNIDFDHPAKFIPTQALPITSAVIYRQAYTRGQLDHLSSMVHASDNIDQAIIFGPTNQFTTTQPTIKSSRSPAHATSSFDNTYDYSIHFGSYPTGRSYDLAFNIINVGSVEGNIVGFNWDTSDPSITVSSGLTSTSLTSGEVHNLHLNFNSSVAGVHEAILDVNIDNGFQSKTIKIQLIAESLDTSLLADLTPQVASFSLALDGTNPPVETETASSLIQTKINHETGADTILFEYIKNNNITSTDGYDKKRLYFRNNSFFDLNNFSVYFLGNLNTYQPVDITGSGNISIESNTCSADMTLISSTGECYIDIKFQPDENASDETFFVGMFYEVQGNQYLMESYQIEFLAKEPSQIFPIGLSAQSITIDGGLVLPNSYHLDPGSPIYYDEYPLTRSFNFLVSNTSNSTKASLLKTYHDWLVSEGVSPVTNTTRPSEPSDYDFSDNGYDFAVIHKTYYGNGDDRFIVRATKGCLVGDDDESEDFRNGFTSVSSNPCYLHVTLNMDMSYIARSLDFATEVDMSGNYLRLPYYSNLRSSIDYMNLYFSTTIKPDRSFKDQGFFNVEALSNGQVSFEWNEMSAENAPLGSISGYRVFLSESKTDITGSLIFNGTTKYYDTTTPDIIINDNLIPGNRYHLTVYPIRFNSNYSGPPSGVTISSFDSLPSGEYISESNIGVLSVVIPPYGYSYIHDKNILLSLEPEDYNPATFPDARAMCSTKAPLTVIDGATNYPLNFSLINSSTWDIIENDVTLEFSDYSNGFAPVQVPHWLDEGTWNVDSELTGVTGYNSASSSQNLSSEGFYYIRDSGCFSCNIPLARGGLYGAPPDNLVMFLGADIAMPLARCKINLGVLP